MDALQLTTIQPVLAARLLAGMSRLDPRGIMCEDNIPAMTRSAECVLATDGEGDQAVFALVEENGVAWVQAAKAITGTGWTRRLFAAIERRAAGCSAVAFQTARESLARRAMAEGYEVTGYILRKQLP